VGFGTQGRALRPLLDGDHVDLCALRRAALDPSQRDRLRLVHPGAGVEPADGHHPAIRIVTARRLAARTASDHTAASLERPASAHRREASALCALRRGHDRDVRHTARRGHPRRIRGNSAGVSPSERTRVVRSLPGKGDLARRPRLLLSLPGNDSHVGAAGCRGVARRRLRIRHTRRGPTRIRVYRLVLVRGDPRARNRIDAGGHAGHGGSLHLHPAGRARSRRPGLSPSSPSLPDADGPPRPCSVARPSSHSVSSPSRRPFRSATGEMGSPSSSTPWPSRATTRPHEAISGSPCSRAVAWTTAFGSWPRRSSFP